MTVKEIKKFYQNIKKSVDNNDEVLAEKTAEELKNRSVYDIFFLLKGLKDLYPEILDHYESIAVKMAKEKGFQVPIVKNKDFYNKVFNFFNIYNGKYYFDFAGMTDKEAYRKALYGLYDDKGKWIGVDITEEEALNEVKYFITIDREVFMP